MTFSPAASVVSLTTFSPAPLTVSLTTFSPASWASFCDVFFPKTCKIFSPTSCVKSNPNLLKNLEMEVEIDFTIFYQSSVEKFQ